MKRSCLGRGEPEASLGVLGAASLSANHRAQGIHSAEARAREDARILWRE